ncbi:MAG: DNA cytosine methyltransferase [[Eubacterium] siraeum]|jgi:DNA (cytosine-5)-methyltransferase 1|nr:MAG TPA: Cytosine specific methyltransferase [Caudoviricetes sp.]
MKNELTLGSLFDGSGGFPLGGMLAGITPLWASEIEPFAVRVTTKRLPQMKHYGDVSSLNGADLPPVDIITFGSPCQDMSIAGKRSGLDGSRSSLFYEAVRIIKEMRCATNGKYPRFAVWENVPGAFSSNKGEDFRCVLESLCRVRDETVSVPRHEKWSAAGNIVADGFSIAWRVLDAQYWGVPQRRKRIFLVADFDSECAGKILFESEGLSGYSAEGFKAWQRTTVAIESSSGTAGAAGFCTEHSAKARGIGYEEETSSTLRAGTVPAAVYENHSQDTRYTELRGIAPTVSSTYGTGGNNQPFVVEDTRCFDVRFTSDGTKNARHNCYETDTSRTIDTGGNSPDSNQGGVAVVAVQGSMIGRADKNGPQGSGVNEDISFTLNATDRHAVAFSQDSYTKYSENDKCGALRACGGMYGGGSETLVYSTSKNSYHTEAEENLANTLVASDYKDPPTVNSPEYIVRRLTPTECARLQGFPDWWCADLGTDNPTEEELRFWKDVFETHRKIVGGAVKPKSEKQIRAWLKNPHSDSSEYKLWGNGVALPCVFFVLSGIAWVSSCRN